MTQKALRWVAVVLCSVLGLCASGSAEQINVFPFVASGGGLNKTLWKSELYLKNTNPATVDVVLEVIPRDGTSVVATHELTLEPGGELRFADLYATIAAPNGFGTLIVRGDVLAWVRTFNKAAGGATYGQNVPAARVSRFNPGESALFPIHKPASTSTEPRSNLVLQSLTDEPQDVTISSGTKSKTYVLQAGVYHQFTDVGAWLGLPAGDSTLSVLSNGTWAGFVSSIDPYSGDSTMVAGERWLDYLFNDRFDTFAGWAYSPGSTPGATFATSSGLLSVANYGGSDDGYGPVARKQLSQPLDLREQDVVVDIALVCSTPSMGELDVQVMLIDQDGMPVMGLLVYGRGGSYAYSKLFVDGVWSQDSSSGFVQSPNGTLSMRLESGSLTAHWNGGPALLTASSNLPAVVQAVEVSFKRGSYWSAPGGLKLDWLRLTRR